MVFARGPTVVGMADRALRRWVAICITYVRYRYRGWLALLAGACVNLTLTRQTTIKNSTRTDVRVRGVPEWTQRTVVRGVLR